MITIKKADNEADYNAVRQLIEEYAAIRNYDVALGDYKAELAALPGKYAEPKGVLLVAYLNEQPAGCVALRQFDEGICEMKRMFVSTQARGQHIGKQLAKAIVQEGQRLGYKKMYLDTHPWMTTAQHIYQSIGFKPTGAYHYNPTPGILFFELTF